MSNMKSFRYNSFIGKSRGYIAYDLYPKNRIMCKANVLGTEIDFDQRLGTYTDNNDDNS